MRFKIFLVAAAIALPPIAANAQDAQPACAATDKSLPPEMAGWATRSDFGSVTKAADLAKGQLTIGRAVNATLHHTPEMSYVTQPEKPGGTVSYGGMLGLAVKEAGTYRIALGAGAWIDVVNGGKATRSTAHGHGPACSTIRKIVDFPLEPGRYVVQISANADPTLAVMVWRQP